MLLARKDIDPNAQDGASQTPLHCAAKMNNVKVAKMILSKLGVDPGAQNSDQQPPHQNAAAKNCVEVADLHGRTALDVAKENDSQSVIDLLKTQ